MIINIRGTSGSGKTTLARQVIGLYKGPKLKFHKPNRRQPLGYVQHRDRRSQIGSPLGIIGHYETACGGCDTIPSTDESFDLVRQAHAQGHDVLFEGLLLTGEFKRTMKLFEDQLPLVVIFLDVPLEKCLANVEARRLANWEARAQRLKAQGKPSPPLPKPLNPKNTESKWKAARNVSKRLQEAGVDCRVLSFDEAFDTIRGLLHI